MALTSYEVPFTSRFECVKDVGLFRFERPLGYQSRAGQWFRLTLDTREGEQTKTFSDAAAPDETTFDLATRLTGSAFKDALEDLRPYDLVHVAGPGGRLSIPAEARRVAFLMGGIGVTPARSMIRDRVRRDDGSVETVLFYGNNDDTCVPFAEEFDDYSARLAWFRLVSVIECPTKEWTGERGFINADTVRKHIDLTKGWHFIVAGPPGMIAPMQKVLAELGVDERHATFESFAGYA